MTNQAVMRCPMCGYLPTAIEPTGIVYPYGSRTKTDPYLIVWNCVCGVKRAMYWNDASAVLQAAAIEVEARKAAALKATDDK